MAAIPQTGDAEGPPRLSLTEASGLAGRLTEVPIPMPSSEWPSYLRPETPRGSHGLSLPEAAAPRPCSPTSTVQVLNTIPHEETIEVPDIDIPDDVPEIPHHLWRNAVRDLSDGQKELLK